jgi:hypothetical protein
LIKVFLKTFEQIAVKSKEEKLNKILNNKKYIYSKRYIDHKKYILK